ncbi:MAG: 50S ribosomal protein L25 [Caldithrix sp.]|nr:50S ribosomal protein L25 [Caldithrix sp.]
MAETIIATKVREDLSKSGLNQLRREDRIPAVYYSEGKEAIPVSLDRHDFEMALKEDHSILMLKVKNKKQQAIVRETQYHPVKGYILHVDFMGIRAGHKVELAVPLHFEGEPAGIQEGGIFSTYKTEINISVLPKDMPDFLQLEVSELNMGDSLRVKDLADYPFEILDDPEDVLCMVEYPQLPEEEEEEVEEEEEMAEPEVIGSRESDEEEEESE